MLFYKKYGGFIFPFPDVMKKFHFLDGLKIGGIENQALTLSSLETSKVENFLINMNKEKNDYPDNFFNQKK